MENNMIHHGARLKDRMKSRGFDMRGLANRLNISRVSVEKDLAKETISRRSLIKYIPVLFDDIEEFYGNEKSVIPQSDNIMDLDMQLRYKDQMLAAKDEIIQEQRKHIDTLSSMLRFFPKAVQQVSVTA